MWIDENGIQNQTRERNDFIQFCSHDIRNGLNHPENCKWREHVHNFIPFSAFFCVSLFQFLCLSRKKKLFQRFQIEYLYWISPSVSVKCSCYDSNQICARFTLWFWIGPNQKRLCCALEKSYNTKYEQKSVLYAWWTFIIIII